MYVLLEEDVSLNNHINDKLISTNFLRLLEEGWLGEAVAQAFTPEGG